MSTLRETLCQLTQAANVLIRELDEAGYSDYSSLPENSPYDLSFLKPEGLGARGDLIAAAERIVRLAKGPQGCLASCADTVLFPFPSPEVSNIARESLTDAAKSIEVGTIQALVQLGVPDKIPLQGSLPYYELAPCVGISPELLQRMVRLSALGDFLREDGLGQVCHSAMSAVFHRDPDAADTARLFFDIDMRAYPFMSESIRLDPTGQSIRNGPTALAFQKDSDEKGNRPTIWEIMERSPVQRARFDSTMQALGTFPSHYLRHVLDAFDWSKVETMVDVGGSLGHASLAIAEKFPAIQIMVQDLPDVVEQGRASLPKTSYAEHISFEPHNCFHEQKTIADAYLLRQILHDWPDEDAERIVRNIVPAMRPGARLLIMDIVVPQPGAISQYMEKYLRVYDISMFSMFSAKERTLQQLCELVERCDKRLRFEGVNCPPGSAASLLSWVYTVDSAV